jgi:glycine/D-amino acid oxidase-like deaminating enzyme
VVPRDAPLLIWTDPQHLPWSDEERGLLAEDDGTRWLLAEFPSGVHMRPEGGPGSDLLLILWTYDTAPREPVWPPVLDPDYPEVLLRGLATMIPGLRQYFGRAARPYYDGGYYTKTKENRLLAGPLPLEGAYICAALSGYGLMSAPAAGELLAAHVTGGALPDYAPAFSIARYADPAYQKLLESWGASGQL